MVLKKIKHLIGPGPELTPLLLGTGVAIVLVLLNLLVVEELWPHYPHAPWWSVVLLGLLLLAGGLQAVAALWGWPAQYLGPRWMRWLIRAASAAVGLGIAALLLPLLLAGGWAVWHLVHLP